MYFTESFEDSLKIFFSKLAESEVMDSMESALARIEKPNDAVKYFCGICWNKIREREDGKS